VLATFSVDRIPPAWLAQVRPGGRIVTPWTSAWCRYGTLELTTGHGFASFCRTVIGRTSSGQGLSRPGILVDLVRCWGLFYVMGAGTSWATRFLKVSTRCSM
jgi:hypothetical protein